MKFLFSIIFAVLAISTAAQAQFTVGLKGGLSATKIEIDEVRNNPWEYRNSENVTGYHAGIFTRLKFGSIFIQPEAVFASTGGKISLFDNQNNTGGQTEKFTFQRLDVPLLAGISFLNVLRVQGGPVASMLLSARQEGKTINDYLNESDWGWQVGVGTDISSFTVDLRYERINRNYSNDSQQSSFKINNHQYLFSLGYKFIK